MDRAEYEQQKENLERAAVLFDRLDDLGSLVNSLVEDPDAALKIGASFNPVPDDWDHLVGLDAEFRDDLIGLIRKQMLAVHEQLASLKGA